MLGEGQQTWGERDYEGHEVVGGRMKGSCKAARQHYALGNSQNVLRSV